MQRLILVLLILLPACTSAVEEVPPTEAEFSGERAFAHAEAQVNIGPRPTGSPEATQTADYIRQQMTDLGYTVVYQEFTYLGRTVRNVIAQQGAVDDTPHILLGAHYDTRLEADEDPSQPTVPVLGANDGASGVAVLIELARVLDTTELPYEVRYVFFDAEDNGRIGEWDWIVGSTYYAENMTQSPEYVIIVDLVGDADQNLYYERNSDQALTEQVWAVAAQLGYGDRFIPEPKYAILDDHTPFLRQGVRAIDIIDFDYPYWHTTEDTLDKISAQSLAAVGRTLEVYLENGGFQEGNP